MRKKVALCTLAISFVAFFTLTNLKAEAGFSDVLNVINQTSYTVNSVGRATRGTLSTVEYGQRFQDRQQDRYDRKRAEKSYNQSAEQEYYKTLQETKQLNNMQNLNVDL